MPTKTLRSILLFVVTALLLAAAPASEARAATHRAHSVHKRSACTQRAGKTRVKRTHRRAACPRSKVKDHNARGHRQYKKPPSGGTTTPPPTTTTPPPTTTTPPPTTTTPPPTTTTPPPTTTTPPPTTTTPPPTSPQTLQYGLNSVAYTDSDLTKVRSAGVTLSRIELGWSDVEPSPGTWRWSGFDWDFTQAARHDVTILPVLMDPPSWAESAWNVIPTNPARYAEYVAAVVARYGPNGTFWKANPSLPYRPAIDFEIWNEPWWVGFAAGGSNPQNYARLYKAAVVAGRAANPDAKYLISADLSGTTTSYTYMEWVDAMYQAVPDLTNYVDGVSVHPYSQPDGPDVYTPSGFDRWQFRRVQDIHQKFINHGAGDKPFWLTEIGWPTCTANPDKCVSESAQAADTQRMLQIVKTDYASFVQAVFLYNYRDPSSQSSSNMEDWFGLLRGDGSAKPAWNVLKQATGAA